MTDWTKVDWLAFDLEQYRRDLGRGVPWEGLLPLLGLTIASRRRTGVLRIKSPWTHEKTPSCVFWPKSGRFICFSSGKRGDKLDFVLGFLNIPEDIFFEATGRNHWGKSIYDPTYAREELAGLEKLFNAARRRDDDPNQKMLDL